MKDIKNKFKQEKSWHQIIMMEIVFPFRGLDPVRKKTGECI